jgi:hypothetical protein
VPALVTGLLYEQVRVLALVASFYRTGWVSRVLKALDRVRESSAERVQHAHVAAPCAFSHPRVTELAEPESFA